MGHYNKIEIKMKTQNYTPITKNTANRQYSILFSFFAIALILLTSCDPLEIRTCMNGNNHVMTETRWVGSDINQWVSEIDADMQIIVSNERAGEVEITAESNILSSIVLDERNGKVEVISSSCWRHYEPIRINVFVSEDLREVTQAGAGTLEVIGQLTAPSIDINMTGTGEIWTDINAEEIDVLISGSGNVHLSGTSGKLKSCISGAGDIKGFNLKTEIADIIITGSGDVETSVNSYLDILIEGSGIVFYKGTPEIHATTLTSGSVIKVN